MAIRMLLQACIMAITVLSSPMARADGLTDSASCDEQQVVATEDEWVQAEINRDAVVLGRVLDDRFLVNSTKGEPKDKATVIADVLSWKMIDQTITDRTVLVDDDTAIVFGTANFRFAVEGKSDELSTARYTTTYVKRNGKWRAIALHMTSI